MVVLISNNKDLVDQQDQYKVLVAMVAFKGLMEGATISNFMLSIAQLELTYESLRPKKLMSQSLSHCQKNHANLESKRTIA